MSAYNKVVWSEGLFLQPQHFQQQDRYFERYVESALPALVPLQLGVHRGRARTRPARASASSALRRAAGVFPDGTPFRMPDDDPLPAPLDIGAQVRDQIVYLAVPLRRAGRARGRPCAAAATSCARHDVRECEARDVASTSAEPAVLEVGALRTRLLPGERR